MQTRVKSASNKVVKRHQLWLVTLTRYRELPNSFDAFDVDEIQLVIDAETESEATWEATTNPDYVGWGLASITPLVPLPFSYDISDDEF